ncbi:uncharacterized protein B0I36DRAFT_5726 [Microdochium trichocladiopsis]|uniref:Uncharacterized protein n=1 Tax=Microdochium trichocladiopsis TaxID=1682393 RepID=A0A9P8YJD1_9PEZI|nr:uncharacterized protein B0I36DRAFT_5726 [Microdochium trichocladiopsis]KAH7040104.1 hypothetical protein B0I36DRAFT_5726 [Microdochium trichocladiopsis]
MACTDVPSSPIREHTGQPEALAPYCGSLREPPQSGVPTRHNVPAGLPHHTVPAGEDEQDGPPSCSRAEAELLSDLDLELGRVQAAVRDAQEAVTLAIRRAESAGDNDDCAQAALCMVQSDLNEARMAVQAHREFSKETREILSPMPMVPPSVPAPQTATALARSIQVSPMLVLVLRLFMLPYRCIILRKSITDCLCTLSCFLLGRDGNPREAIPCQPCDSSCPGSMEV